MLTESQAAAVSGGRSTGNHAVLMAHVASRHPRDLTDEQWHLIGPFLPQLPRRPDGQGRPSREHRAVLNGILWFARITPALFSVAIETVSKPGRMMIASA